MGIFRFFEKMRLLIVLPTLSAPSPPIPPMKNLQHARTAGRNIVLPITLAMAVVSNAHSQNIPSSPVFGFEFQDAVTGTNEFNDSGVRRWYVSPGADSYHADQYERPTNQSYSNYSGKYATDGDYFGNLDIVSGQAGWNSTHMFFAINMFSTNLETKDGATIDEGLKYAYGIRLGHDPDGSGGYLFNTDNPYDFGTTWKTEKNFVYADLNGDLATGGNGYEAGLVSDGMMNGEEVFWTRLRPGDASVVEFAIDYSKLNIGPDQISDIPYIVFEASKGLQDPANYLWNKEYTSSEAGSPNPGVSGLSEFGTEGPGNIYELDTLRGGAIPEPSTALLIVLAGLIQLIRRRV